MTNAQNIVVIGSGHLLSILAENARLRAALAWYLEDDKRSVDDGTLENIRDRPAYAALQEQEAKQSEKSKAPVGPCPAGGEHDWPAKTGESYTGVCLKCGQGR